MQPFHPTHTLDLMDYARLPRVLVAILYDTLIVFTLIFIAAQWFPLIPEHLQMQPAVRSFKIVYILGICFLYFGYSWRRGGQTIGMKAWRLKIVNSDHPNAPVSWQQCMIRYMVAIGSWIAIGIGFLWILFSKQHRSWHDSASKTKLILLAKP